MSYRLVVLVSGSGTLLQSLIDAESAGSLDAQIVAVGSDRPRIAALDRAETAGLPAFVHPLAPGADRDAWDAELARLIGTYDPDLVVSAGFMKLVGRHTLDAFAGRLINTHPALLPSFPGAHGVRDALAYGVKVTGCTVFAIDEGVDTGAILAQEAVRVEPDDTEETLHERIKVAERALLVETINTLAARHEEEGRS